jgi:Zn finger protein HypA/HybF involved in hydrogenase expression
MSKRGYEKSPYVRGNTKLTLLCLKCNKPFKSVDKVYNRLCSKCNSANVQVFAKTETRAPE